jgi:glycosyltransferase involved in cell wall biosynthesis
LIPRVLFVGRGRLTFPLARGLVKKWDALGEVFEWRALNAGSGEGDGRFTLLPDDAFAFYPRLVFDVARALRRFRADAIIASDPYVGAAALGSRRLARVRPKVIVEVHGDPRTFTRLYGSPARRALSWTADAIARFGLQHADATRALSGFTSSLVEEVRGVPATACFPTYSDLDVFRDRPPEPVPEARRVVFVAALERYKNVDGLAVAWRRVSAQVPDATLVVVGRGSRREVIDRLHAELPGRVVRHEELLPEEVAAEIDRSRALVLPSWPEGLGRVVLEAFARGRTVVATNAGGIRDIVTDGHDGILIPVGDTEALAEGMLRVLEDRELAARLGSAARRSYAPWHQTAEDFAQSYRDLVDRALAGAR